MRLLYLTRSYTGHDARWLRALAEQGVTLAFLPVQRIDTIEFSRVHPHATLLASPELATDAGTPALDAALPAVQAQVEAWVPDVIVAGPLTDAGYLAAKIAPEKTLLMSWAFDVWHEPTVLPGAGDRLRSTLRSGQHLFADCQSVARACEAIAGGKFSSLCVLPWGLAAEDTPAPSRGLRRRLGDEAAKVFFFARGFAAVHQPLLVIDAFRRAQAQDKSLRLWLAGSGALQAEAEAAVARSGLTGVVRFLGSLDQAALAGAFAEADLSVACSLSDGSSIALLQAMHAGLPCIAADLPSNREWLQQEGNWLVPVNDVAALSAAMKASLALSPAARARVATINRQRVRQHADLAANLPRLLATLRSIAVRSLSTQPNRLAV